MMRKQIAICCHYTMLPIENQHAYICVRCHRVISFKESKMWKPTVPHPLLQIDEALHRQEERSPSCP